MSYHKHYCKKCYNCAARNYSVLKNYFTIHICTSCWQKNTIVQVAAGQDHQYMYTLVDSRKRPTVQVAEGQDQHGQPNVTCVRAKPLTSACPCTSCRLSLHPTLHRWTFLSELQGLNLAGLKLLKTTPVVVIKHPTWCHRTTNEIKEI